MPLIPALHKCDPLPPSGPSADGKKSAGKENRYGALGCLSAMVIEGGKAARGHDMNALQQANCSLRHQCCKYYEFLPV
jgi:hypothetical protein